MPRQTPMKKVAVVRTTYWACNCEPHRHTTKQVAQKCIDLYKNKQPGLTRAQYKRRSNLVVKLRKEGKTLKAIGKRIGVSTERVRQIEAKHNRRERWKKAALLSQATQNIQNLQKESRQEITKARLERRVWGLKPAEDSLDYKCYWKPHHVNNETST